MKRLIGIIADDLTGANDSGIQLTEKGINTSVFFDIPHQADNLDSGIVLDTDSRTLSEIESIEATRQAGTFLKKEGYSIIYKKLDSTLRGYIGTELQALYEIFIPEFVFIAPAFPALGRVTKNGIHYVHGKKVTDTEIRKDPKHSVDEAFIPALIEKEIGKSVGLLKKGDIEGDFSLFKQKIVEFKEKEVNFLVCDAETQIELLKAVKRMNSLSKKVIWSGSAGLAKVLPDGIGISRPINHYPLSLTGSVMAVCGSLSSITRKQVQFAKEQQGVRGMELDTTRVFSKDWKVYRQEFIKECLKTLKGGKDIVLYVPSNEEIRIRVKNLGQELRLTDNQIGSYISSAISEIAECVVSFYISLTGLVLTGGDIAKDTTSRLGGYGFNLIKEVEDGIPLGTVIGSDREFSVVTKAGAFGKKDSIYNAMQVLKGANRND